MKARVAVLAAWASVFGMWIWYQRQGGSTVELAQRSVETVDGNWWAIVAYTVFSALRPVLLIPATITTVAAGLLFGPYVGIPVAIGGAVGAAFVSYTIGRWLRRSPTDDETTDQPRSPLKGWLQRLRHHAFESVLLMRLLFLPYDIVSYGCGLARVAPIPFLAATTIGIVPGSIAFVLVGASVERLDQGLGGLNAGVLAMSAVLVVISIALSRVLRRRAPVTAS